MSGNECEPKQEKQDELAILKVLLQLIYNHGGLDAYVLFNAIDTAVDASFDKGGELTKGNVKIGPGTWIIAKVPISTDLVGINVVNPKK